MSTTSHPTTSFAEAVAGQSASTPNLPISKVDVTLTEPNVSVADVSKAFNQIGKVDEVKKKDAMTFTVFFATNAKRSAVATAASDELIERPVKRMKLDTIPDALNQQPRPTILTDLNDDCLMEVFEWLNRRNLYELAYVCRHFRAIAVRAYKHKFNDDLLQECDLRRITENYTKEPLHEMFLDFIRIFNPVGIEINEGYDYNNALQKIALYSSDLRELGITNCVLDAQTHVALQPILPKLRKLRIEASSFLNACTNVEWQLEDLVIGSCKPLDMAMPTIRMPQLTKVTFLDFTWEEFWLVEFLIRNVQLTNIELDACNFNWANWCALAEYMPNVRELKMYNMEIESTGTDMDMVPATLKCLTTCRITSEYFEHEHIVEMLRGAPIKRLIVNFPPDDDDFVMRLVRSLSSLQELCIYWSISSVYCIEKILSTAKAITTCIVHLSPNEHELEPIVLQRISPIVAGRPELKLRVHVYGSWIAAAEHVWRPHTKWLLVKSSETTVIRLDADFALEN